jgi:hypothetical protein
VAKSKTKAIAETPFPNGDLLDWNWGLGSGSGGSGSGSSGGSSGSSGMGLGGILSGGGYRTPEISESPLLIKPINTNLNEFDWEAITADLDWENTKRKLDGFNAGNTVKTELIKQAEKFSELTPATKTYLNVFKAAGTALGIVSFADALVQATTKPTPGNYLRLGVSVGTLFLRVNPAAAVVLGVLDASGASDHAYQWIDHQLGY